MKEKLKEYFESELHYTKIGLNGETDLIQRGNIVWYALQRGLGATQFAQYCGMRYLDVEPMFEEYKQKLEAMRYETD